MKQKELQELIKVSYHQVGLYGRDAARIYHAVVALDSELLKLRKELAPKPANKCEICEETPCRYGDCDK